MTTRVWSALAVAAVVVAGVSIDLTHQARAAARRSRPAELGPSVAAGTRTFADPRSGICLTYPAAWHHQPARTAELAVADPTGRLSLSLDVPAMSWHPPFIPVGLVSSRYVDALRQDQLPDGVVRETADLKVAGATARRCTVAGHAKAGAAAVDTAVVIVHGGQVYILSCDSDAAGAAAARRVLDAAVASVQWTK